MANLPRPAIPIVVSPGVRGPCRPYSFSYAKRIVREAAEQSGRGRLPDVEAAMPFSYACKRAEEEGGLGIIPWEGVPSGHGERIASLRALLDGQQAVPKAISLFIGPEGGFTAGEAELARCRRIHPVTLGPRVLRSETAGLVAATAILHQLGDLE